MSELLGISKHESFARDVLKTKAYASARPGEALALVEIPRRRLGPHDILIDIHYCGVCHSDIHQSRDEWSGGIFPMVPGHEITGVVAGAGSAVTRFSLGDPVGVGCMVDACRECNPCLDGDEQYCERGPIFTYNSKDRNGAPTYGGYSGQIVVDEDFVLRIPRHLPLDRAAPLLCAGITTYSPLRHWHAGRGQNVAIIGFGGLGHMGVKFAKAMGAHVTVLSRSEQKAADAKKLGADQYFSLNDQSALQKRKNSFHLILNTISAPHDLNGYLDLLRFEGTMVVVGVPPEGSNLNHAKLILQRRNLSGSHIGGLVETQKMLDFCGQNDILSDIELIQIDTINDAYDRVLKGDVRYRFVIDCKPLRQ